VHDDDKPGDSGTPLARTRAILSTLSALLFSGTVQAVMSPPHNWIFLHPVSWVPALWVFSRLNGRRALLAGWLVGASAELAIFRWLPGTMIRFGSIPVPLALALWLLFAGVTGFYVAVFAWGFGRIRRAGGRRWPLAIGAWFCALEFLNPQIFPYLQGVGWYQIPRVFLFSALTGVSGVTFLVIVCNAVVLQGLEAYVGGERAERRACALNATVLAGLVLVAVGYSSHRLADIDRAEGAADAMRLAIVQPNHTIARRRAMMALAPDAFARDLVVLSRRAEASSPDKIDVFVWPEGALRADPAQPRNRAVLDFVRETGAEVWTGGGHHERLPNGQEVAHNSAFRIYGDGVIDTRYDKNILVPFGEYLPLRGVIPGLDRIDAIGDFEAGRSVPKYVAGPAHFVFLICYEAIRSAFVRAAIGTDVNLIVNVTIDAWYGRGAEQSQHLMLAAVQSALNGLPLVRATSTGVSAFVDARGLITARTGNFTRETLVRDVRPIRVPSPYSRWGEWFAWCCVAAAALLLLVGGRRN
jgi:apolipoprotein N-acyltransferase